MRIRSSSIHFGRQRLHRLAALILAVSLALQALLPVSVFAYTNTVDTSSMPIGAVSDHIRKVSEMYMVAACFRYARINNSSPDQYVEKGDIFYSGTNSTTTASLGAYVTGKQGTAASDWGGADNSLTDQLSSCDHGQNWLEPIANDLGYTGQNWAVQVACAASFYRWTSNDQSKGLYGDACLNAPATYNFYQANDQNKNAQDFIKATSAKIGGTTLTPAEQYLYNVNTLLIGCGGTDSGKPVDTTKTDTLYAQQQRQIAAGTAAGVTIVSGNGNSAATVNEFYTFGTSAQHAAGSQSGAAVQISDLRRTTYGMETGADESKIPVACSDLLANANKLAPMYLTVVSNGQLQNQTQQTRCTSSDSSTNCSTSNSTSSCQISGIGWIVCPVMSFLGDLNDKAYGVLSNFLTIKPSLITNKNLVASWSNFRDLANIAFVIAFIVIIYSQITGAGITNYGIKKMLPKIIVAAVLVNVSLYVCQIAVDISNILGNSVYGLLQGLPSGASNGVNPAGSWATVIGEILTIAVGIGLLIAVILAPVALLAVGIAVLILVARQAILVLLIVISPLAFVAYLLPNTESWFKKWWKIFSTLLMLYPIIGLVFGASTLAANIINSAAGSDQDHLMQLTALGIMAVPLFAVPTLLKGSLNTIGSLGGRISSLQDRANNRAKRGVKESRIGEAKTAWDRHRQGVKAERRAGIGSGLRARANRAFDSTRLGRAVGGARGAAHATSEYGKTYEEDVKAADTLLQSRMSHEQILNAAASGTHEGRVLTEHERDAAVRYAMERGNYNERRGILEGRDMAGNLITDAQGNVVGGIGTMTRSQRKSAIGGMRAKGDTAIHGNAALAALEATDVQGRTGHNSGQVTGTLAGGTAEAINHGTLSIEDASKDHRTAAYVAGVATGTTATTDDLLGRPAVTIPARTNLHNAVNDFELQNPQAWTKLGANVQNSLRSI